MDGICVIQTIAGRTCNVDDASSILSILSILSSCTVHAVSDGKSAGCAVSKGDSIGVNIPHFTGFGNRGDAVTILPVLSVLSILSICTIHTISYGKGAGCAVGESDGIGVNISCFAGFGDRGDAIAIGTVIARFALRSLRSGSPLAQEEGLRSAAGFSDGNHITAISGNDGKCGNIASLAGI